MSETITFHALDLAGETGLKLYLRKNDGTLLNTGGDAFTDLGSAGVFTATLAESRVGLGTLHARICEGTETAENSVYEEFLPESVTVIGSAGDAVLNAATQTQIDNIESGVAELRSLEVIFEGVVTSAGAAAIQFATSGYAENQLRDMLVVFETGDGAGESSPIKSNRIINGSIDEIEFAENLVITPSVGSTFTVRAAHIHSVAAIQSGLATQTSVNDIPTNSELTTALAAADDAVLAAISALNNLSAAQVNSEILDVFNVDTFGELSAPPAASSTLAAKLTWLFMWARNKATQNATERKLYADNGTTIVSTEVVSDTSGTFTKGEAS